MCLTCLVEHVPYNSSLSCNSAKKFHILREMFCPTLEVKCILRSTRMNTFMRSYVLKLRIKWIQQTGLHIHPILKPKSVQDKCLIMKLRVYSRAFN